MCTYSTVTEAVEGSAKGPGGSWTAVKAATVYFDHPVHAQAGHTLNIDLVDPDAGPGGRFALELTAASARALVRAIESALDAVPAEMGIPGAT
jgi:hypothetical protein